MKLKILTSLLGICAFAGLAYAQDAEPTEDVKTPAAETAKKLPPEAKAIILKNFDKDGDGFLNDEELAEARQAIERRKERLLERQKLAVRAILKEFDANGDGKLDETELLPFIAKQNQLFAEMRAQLPPEVRRKMMEDELQERRARGGEGRRMQAPADGERPRQTGNREGRGPRPDGQNMPRRLPQDPISAEDLNELTKPKSE